MLMVTGISISSPVQLKDMESKFDVVVDQEHNESLNDRAVIGGRTLVGCKPARLEAVHLHACLHIVWRQATPTLAFT